MKTKHTKGPWKVIDKFTVSPLELNCGCEQTQCEECEANAKLIAAAPEMLEALERILDPKFRNDVGWTAIARLIKKAKGE